MKITKKALARRLSYKGLQSQFFLASENLDNATVDATFYLRKALLYLPRELQSGKHYLGHVVVFRWSRYVLMAHRIGMNGTVFSHRISLAELRRKYNTPPNKRKDWWSYQNRTKLKLPVSQYRW
jgi:hypothetical protein